MGLDIFGWVELHEKPLNKWRGVIKIHDLLGRDYTAYHYLFSDIAQRRCMPDDASREARYELDEDGYLSHSWIMWEEINQSEWQSKGFSETWQLLIEMMRLLTLTYGANSVRLVVAFS
jgi:hypothetical protein